MTPLIAAPNPAPAKNTARIRPPAAIFHFTQADMASAISERISTHNPRPRKIPQAIHRLARVHSQPARLPLIANRARPGIQVMLESKNTSTLIFPTTYSVRENGRQKYSGSELLARSGATRLGPTNAVSR